MPEPTNDLLVADRKRQLLLTASVAVIFGFVVSYVFAILDINDALRTVLVSDIRSYEDIAGAMLDGLVPYLDFTFEHLPVAALPIAVVGFVAKVTGVSMWLLWPIFMAPLFVATALWVDRLDLQDPAGFRFVAVSVPLLPLILFRLEPLIEFLAVAGLLAFVVGQVAKGSILTVAATLGKGWPIALALFPWRAGRRLAAGLTVTVSAILLGLTFALDGFRSGRAFTGIHTETVTGSLVLLFRHMTGSDLGIETAAGALYIDVPDFTVVINAIPGLVLVTIGLIGAITLPSRFTLSAIGITILGIMFMSPLSSTQFVYWIAPFVAMLASTERRVYIVAGVLAFTSTAIYQPESILWNLEVIARNVALVTLAVLWAASLIRAMRQPSPTTALP